MTTLGCRAIGRMIGSTPDLNIRMQRCIDFRNPSFDTHAAPASLLGGYGVGDPPDPISNSAVKPDSADGTIAQAMEE
jgi:hypothetical protein